MDAKQLKQTLTLQNIQQLLQSLDASPIYSQGNLVCKTICHSGHKHKLYYYPDKQIFVCYTGNCGNMDIFSLIQRVQKCNFFAALRFIQDFFGFKQTITKITTVENPMDGIRKALHQHSPKVLETLDANIINSYYQFATPEWLNEGITFETMEKYNIRYSILDQAIVIPHFSPENKLVGVRGRNLNPETVNRGFKYTPLRHQGKLLRYPTGENLYGLNLTKQAIKKSHQIILFEAEKSVLKLDSAIGDLNNSVALDGSNLTAAQIEIIKQLDVSEIVVALDKEFDRPFSRKERIYAEKIQSQFTRILSRFQVSIVWDIDDSLNEKDSPIDQGYSTFEHLIKNRIYL